MRLPFLGKKSGAYSISATGSYGRLADEIVLNLKNFKIIYWMKYLTFAMFNKGTVSL